MAFKSHTFSTQVHWKEGQPAFTDSLGLPPLAFDSPSSFGGQQGQWTPENFLVAAIEGCTHLTFMAFAKRKQVAVKTYQSTALGELASAEDGSIRFTRFEVRPVVEVATKEDAEKAWEIFATVGKHCFIGNSVRAEPFIVAEVKVVAS